MMNDIDRQVSFLEKEATFEFEDKPQIEKLEKQIQQECRKEKRLFTLTTHAQVEAERAMTVIPSEFFSNPKRQHLT
ncbi:hypothetical protein ILUMI_10013, partial [Ignelater luminosus]